MNQSSDPTLVKVTITVEAPGERFEVSKSGPAIEHMESALLHDLIPVARAGLGVPEEDEWRFGEGE